MFVDSRTARSGDLLEADVCIIGAGAAGITLARELAETRLRVSLLESGGLGFDPEVHALNKGDVTGLPYFPLDACRLRYFGGTTNHWNGACWPLEAMDFEVRPGIPHSGWPLALADLEPYYARAHAVCELGPYDYDVANWEARSGRSKLPFDAGLVRTKILQSSPPTRFGFAYHKRLDESPNVTVHLHANVLELESDRHGARIRQVRIATGAGHEFRLRARLFVLATGGLENPRLLLASRSARPEGLGNRHDRVGRFFMDHMWVRGGVLALHDPDPATRFYQKHPVEGSMIRGVLAPSEDWLRDEGLLGFSANLRRLQVGPFSDFDRDRFPGIAAFEDLRAEIQQRKLPDHLGDRLTSIAGDLDELGSRFWRRLRTGSWPGFDQLVLLCQTEQAPNPESRVRLGSRRDPFGIPRIELDWRLSELDKKSVRGAMELLAREAGRLGLGRVRVDLDGPDDEWARWDGRRAWRGPAGSYHAMGTTRMHEDARHGVVDADCRVHGIENLWVAGSSVFATSSHVNPTLTIVALALRLADHLKSVA